MDHIRTDGVRYTALADAANYSTDGKVNILGEFNQIHSAAAPGVWPRMFYAAKLEFSPTVTGEKRYEVRIAAPDGQMCMPPQRGRVNLPKSESTDSRFISVIIEIRNIVLPEFGTYTVELWEVTEAPRQVDTFGLYFREWKPGEA